MSIEFFAKLGRSHAMEAIDQVSSFEDARGEYEDNLRDTLAEQHKNATSLEIEIALDTYNTVWNNFLADGPSEATRDPDFN